jgi:hypothetical protein
VGTDPKRLVSKDLELSSGLLVLKRKMKQNPVYLSHFEVPLPAHPNESVMLRL